MDKQGKIGRFFHAKSAERTQSSQRLKFFFANSASFLDSLRPLREFSLSTESGESMAVTYISFGSNIGDRIKYIETAMEIIRENPCVQSPLQVSSYYETEPVGYIEQPKFINGVARIDTTLSCEDLLEFLQRVECMLGRERTEKTVRWGPRSIDLDILLYDNACILQPNLHVPHPEMQNRAFVMVPLNEIAPEVRYPISGKTIRELVEKMPETGGIVKWNVAIQ